MGVQLKELRDQLEAEQYFTVILIHKIPHFFFLFPPQLLKQRQEKLSETLELEAFLPLFDKSPFGSFRPDPLQDAGPRAEGGVRRQQEAGQGHEAAPGRVRGGEVGVRRGG